MLKNGSSSLFFASKNFLLILYRGERCATITKWWSKNVVKSDYVLNLSIMKGVSEFLRGVIDELIYLRNYSNDDYDI